MNIIVVSEKLSSNLGKTSLSERKRDKAYTMEETTKKRSLSGVLFWTDYFWYSAASLVGPVPIIHSSTRRRSNYSTKDQDCSSLGIMSDMTKSTKELILLLP